MADLTGQYLGRYHIIEPLGQGGMASVYKAFDTTLERHVAIKIIRSDIGLESQGEFLKRFQREAKSLAQLDHPYILKVLDYGDQEGLPYLVMPFLEGGTLKDRMGQPMPYNQAAALLAPIARALEFAHQQNVIHRDVKPANILISKSGAPILSDFGIAKILGQSGSTQLTGAGVGIGTPDYMAPEQWTGTADARTDIYSLGVVFYQMVTGRLPFSAETPAAVLIKHLRDPLPRPKSFVHDLPDEVEQILFKALAKEPENRYQTMGELALALEDLSGRKPAPVQEDLKTQIGFGEATAAKRITPLPAPAEATRIAAERQPSPMRILLSWKLWLPIALITLITSGGWWLANNWQKPSLPDVNVSGAQTQAPEWTIPPASTDAARPTLVQTSLQAATSTMALTSTPEPTAAPAATSTPGLRLGQTISSEQLGAGIWWGGIAFSPDGLTVNALTLGYSVNTGNFNYVYYNDANLLAFAANDLEMRAIPLETPAATTRTGIFSPDGQIAAGLSENGTLSLWQASDGSLLNVIMLEGANKDIYSLEMSPDGKILAGLGINKVIHLWQVSDGSLLKSLKQETGFGSSRVAFSPDGETLVSAGGLSRAVFLYRVPGGALLQTLEEPGSVYAVAFSPDGKVLASGLKSGNIDLWDIETGTLLRTLDGTKTSVTGIVFSPNGQYMASTASGAVDLWRVEDGKLLQAYPSETQYSIASLAFSPDSQLLAALAQVGVLRLLGVVP